MNPVLEQLGRVSAEYDTLAGEYKALVVAAAEVADEQHARWGAA